MIEAFFHQQHTTKRTLSQHFDLAHRLEVNDKPIRHSQIGKKKIRSDGVDPHGVRLIRAAMQRVSMLDDLPL